jgi:predicted DNA-binding transcriptional regulator AlpA
MEILRLSRVSIYRLINKGDIKPIKLSGKVLFLEEDIQALIDRLKKKR